MFPKAIEALVDTKRRAEAKLATLPSPGMGEVGAARKRLYHSAIQDAIDDYDRALDVLRHADGEIRKMAQLQGEDDCRQETVNAY